MAEPTRPFWLDGAPYQDFRSAPELPARADVVVIGGGITGVSAAYWLGGLGVEVLVLERRGLAGGATGRNGGHISPGTGERFSESCARYGPRVARAIWDFSHRCAEAVAALVAAHEVECGLRFGGSVSLALTPEELRQVEATAEALAALGVPVEAWDRATCGARTHGADFLGGVLRRSAGQLWPARLVFALAEQALARGAAIHTGTAVRGIERERGGLVVRTDHGDVRAGRVIHATNAWARHLLPALDGVIVPVRGQVIVTEPTDALW